MTHNTPTDGGVRGSEALLYLEAHWRLRLVADILPISSVAWKRLDCVATRCRIRVLFAPWYRSSQSKRLQVLHGWRFSDNSWILRLNNPVHLEVLGPQGISAVLMHDTKSALRHLLRYVDIPLFDALARTYLSHHGHLPALNGEDLVYALNSSSRELRMAAIASLSTRERTKRGSV